MPNPMSALVSACTPSRPPDGRVLEQARDEPGRAAELRAPPQGQQHDHDERDVGRHVGDAQRRAQGGVGDTASEHGDRRRACASATVAVEERRHVVGALTDDQQHLVDAREVHGGRELRRSGRAPSRGRRWRAPGRSESHAGRGRRTPEVTTRSPTWRPLPSRAMYLKRIVPRGSPSTMPAVRARTAWAPTVEAGSISTCTIAGARPDVHHAADEARRAR